MARDPRTEELLLSWLGCSDELVPEIECVVVVHTEPYIALQRKDEQFSKYPHKTPPLDEFLSSARFRALPGFDKAISRAHHWGYVYEIDEKHQDEWAQRFGPKHDVVGRYHEYVVSVGQGFDVERDIVRFSGLQSWYKHLRNESGLCFPLLLPNEKRSNGIDPKYSQGPRRPGYWQMIFDLDLERFGFTLGSVLFMTIPNCLVRYMQKFPVILDHHFGNSIELSAPQETACIESCRKFHALVLQNEGV